MIQVIKYESFCEQGTYRTNNEDFICPQTLQGRVYVLCDGMGGHGHGEVASAVVGMSVHNYLIEQAAEEYTSDMLQEALDFAVDQLNKEAKNYYDERPMGTTLVVVVLNRYNVLIGHVGDSRCYLLDSDGNKKFRTRDHSMVAEAVENEILTEEEAFISPKKNILTRSVQAGKEERIEIAVDICTDVRDGDYLLLCTDGVNDALRDKEIEFVLSEGTIDERISRLKERCASNSHDNYSAIFLQLRQDEQCPVTNETVRYCPMCGAPITKEGNNIYTECVQNGQIQEHKKTKVPFEEEVCVGEKKYGYFPNNPLDNPEEYINIGGIKIKKKVYVWGSIMSIVGLFMLCLMLLLTLLFARNMKKEEKQLKAKEQQIINLDSEYVRKNQRLYIYFKENKSVINVDSIETILEEKLQEYSKKKGIENEGM